MTKTMMTTMKLTIIRKGMVDINEVQSSSLSSEFHNYRYVSNSAYANTLRRLQSLDISPSARGACRTRKEWGEACEPHCTIDNKFKAREARDRQSFEILDFDYF